jgi:hypothetical protein
METTMRANSGGPEKGGRLARVRSLAVGALAVVGLVLAALLVGGVIADGLSFDRTSGGYEPPYTGYTGEPIDWEAAHVTEEGFFKDGYVLDLYVDCTTGMVSFEVYGRRWDWRELSGRALVVHRPAEACESEGFRPDF